MRVLAVAPAVGPARATKASAPTRRAALAMFLAPSLTVVARNDAAMAKTDYETDAKAVLDAQRKLLRDGKGDAYATYRKAADEFFATYKFVFADDEPGRHRRDAARIFRREGIEVG